MGLRLPLLALLTLPAAAALADLPVAPGTVRLDGLAAVIEPNNADGAPSIILRSDVELRARLKLSGQAGKVVLGPLPEGLLGATLDELIGELLLEREASRLGLDTPSGARVRTQRTSLAEMAGGEQRLLALAEALGVGRREIDRIATRRATVQGFLETNLVGTTDVTTAELERVYATGDHPFSDKPLAEVSAQLEQWVGAERMRCSVRRWVQGLRARAEVRLLVRYGREAPEPGAERCSVTGPAATPNAEGRQ